MSAVTSNVCPVCGDELPCGRMYCSMACRRKGNSIHLEQGIAIAPSETKGRKAPMTDAEFDAMYQQLQRELRDAGKPLFVKRPMPATGAGQG